jgi:hypothetical protein
LDQEKDKFARDTLDIQKQLERVKKFNEYLPQKNSTDARDL